MKSILIADDEKNLARLAQVNLERAGYRVTTVSDGKEALAAVALEQPDLIISDVMMPHLDGFELLKRLKSDQSTRSIPVILLTVRSHDRDILFGSESGAAAYLPKPFNPEELVAMVREVLESESR